MFASRKNQTSERIAVMNCQSKSIATDFVQLRKQPLWTLCLIGFTLVTSAICFSGTPARGANWDSALAQQLQAKPLVNGYPFLSCRGAYGWSRLDHLACLLILNKTIRVSSVRARYETPFDRRPGP